MQLDVDLKLQLDAFKFAADFSVEGRRIGIFGPSGSGKSTLVNLLAGLLPPDEGSIHLDGRILHDSRSKISLPPEQRRVAVVFQHAHLFPHLNVQRNLLYGYRRTLAKRRKLKVTEVARALDIEHLLKRSVAALSGGERQRVALGRALLAAPDLLILDEPLSALDHGLKEQIIPFLRRTLRRFDIPYLYISHSLSEMRLLTDQVMVFHNGTLKANTDAETMARDRLARCDSGYLNHLQLGASREVGDLLAYRWGSTELVVSSREQGGPGLFGLASKDILLFKRHPQALSARNLLEATLVELIPCNGTVGVVLDCGGERLVAQVVREAAAELDLREGGRVFAAIKAAAFRRLL
ncbi:MAG: molybdenum ABC transporter ATP-binding protein [Syntrophotaleaceae bacterium]